MVHVIVLVLVQDDKTGKDPSHGNGGLVDGDHFHLLIVLHGDIQDMDLDEGRWWDHKYQESSQVQVILIETSLDKGVNTLKNDSSETRLEGCAQDKDQERHLDVGFQF